MFQQRQQRYGLQAFEGCFRGEAREHAGIGVGQ